MCEDENGQAAGARVPAPALPSVRLKSQRVVAGVEEGHFGAKQPGRALRFGAADLLGALHGHAGLLPGALALATFPYDRHRMRTRWPREA